jgi:hypothetical protein
MVSNKGVDSSYIRIEHNFAAPDAIKNNSNNFRLNTQHYWKIDGMLSSGFVSKIRFNYNGNKSTSGNNYLDTCLTKVNGDSIILLYRKNAADDWKEVSHYIKFKVSSKSGFCTADTLKFGEYVFANGHSNVLLGINETKHTNTPQLNIFPNPSSSIVNINISHHKITNVTCIEIYDMQGKFVKRINSINSENSVSVSDLAKGQYIINLMDKNKTITSKTFVVE